LKDLLKIKSITVRNQLDSAITDVYVRFATSAKMNSLGWEGIDWATYVSPVSADIFLE
jgi:hypothetical protein